MGIYRDFIDRIFSDNLEFVSYFIKNRFLGIDSYNDLFIKTLSHLKKMIKIMGEKCKVSIRNIRREGNDDLKKKLKSKEISEDDEKKFEKIKQSYTDNFVKKIAEKVAIKEQEILTI